MLVAGEITLGTQPNAWINSGLKVTIAPKELLSTHRVRWPWHVPITHSI